MSQSRRVKPGPLEPHTVAPDGAPSHEQPRWRRDFPIDWGEDDYVSRRDLAKYVVLTSGAFVVGQAAILWRSRSGNANRSLQAMAVATVDELPVGGAKTFFYPEGSTPRLLVRTGATEFVAYDQQCTHLQCPVVPVVAEGKLHCPCHNGWFDLKTGDVLQGPPVRRLPRVLLKVQDGNVFAVGVEESST